MKNLMFKSIYNKAAALTLALSAAFMVSSCIEEPESEINGKGANRFRMESEEDFSVVTFKPNATETKSVLTIFRDANSSSSMNESVTVDLSLSQDSLDAYNEEHETEYELVPTAAYTLNVNPGSVTFGPQEAAKTVRITLNTALLDLSRKYVMPFVLRNSSGDYTVSDRANLQIVQMLPINKYDGVYAYTGSVERWSAGGAAANDGLDGEIIPDLFVELGTVSVVSASL
jgi:hypothetical protein